MPTNDAAAAWRRRLYALVSRHLRIADWLWDRHADFRRWWGPLRPIRKRRSCNCEPAYCRHARIRAEFPPKKVRRGR